MADIVKVADANESKSRHQSTINQRSHWETGDGTERAEGKEQQMFHCLPTSSLRRNDLLTG